MSINYSLFQIPTPIGKDDDQQFWTARFKSNGTKSTKDLCKIISTCTTFNPGEIKGMLDVLNQWITIWMEQGYNISLDGLGTLSLSLKSENVNDQRGKGVVTQIDSINFLPCTDLKNAVKEFPLTEVKRSVRETFTPTQRKERAMDYIAIHYCISTSQYIQFNHCNRPKALSELKEMVNDKLVFQIGNARSVMYIKRE